MATAASEYIEKERKLGVNNYHPLDVVLCSGKGVWLWDLDGAKYLDCLSAYSAVNQGHCNPNIRAALITQSEELTLTSRAFRNDQLPLFYEELAAVTGAEKILAMNSGAEAVESAIKVARKWGYEVKGIRPDKAEIIVASNNFHGRTTAIVGFSTDQDARANFGPFSPGFRIIPFGDAEALEDAISEKTAGVLLEPIQGEAGVIIPPKGYLPRVRQLCTENYIPLILDEIQTGLGRTGRMLAQEHDGVTADLTLLGKALSGGFYPVSAVVGRAEFLDVLQPGQHGSTFGGNPLACAVSRAAIRTLIDDRLVENAAIQGEYFKKLLSEISSGIIKEVRGRGLLLAIELTPDAGGARRYCENLMREGLLCKDTQTHSIRLAPPLVITRDEIDWAVEKLAAVLR